MQQSLPDEEILALFRSPVTKEKGYTLLVNKYKERLYWHIRRMVVVHEDADDVLQNVFIKTWNGLNRFREDSRLFTWLYRIATNESLTHLKNQKKKTSFEAGFDEQGLQNKVKADAYFDPKKIEWKLQLAIQTLPEQQRLVFNLRYFDEMPYQEMSEITGVSVGALKASFHHAAKKVQQYLTRH